MARTKAELNMIGQSGATDGQIPSWNNTNDEWEAVDAPSGGGGGGKVAQVVSTSPSNSDTVTTSTAWEDISGFSVTITPSSNTSKVFVTASIGARIQLASTSTNMGVRLVRGATVVDTGIGNFWTENNDGAGANISLSFLDSPGTSSAATYKVQISRQTGNGECYVMGSAVNCNTITAMEILV